MGPEDISTHSVLKTEAYPPQSKLMLAAPLLLLVASLSAQHCYSSDDSSTPSPGLTAQRCGTDNTMYYCPLDESCHPREERCTLASNCIDRHEVENKCYKSEIEKAYTIYLGHAFPVAAGSSLSEHQFIQYRGFTYEFAPRYGVQILDVNDPDYKYLNQRNITRNGIQNVGHSYCTWLDTTLFAERWQKGDHNLFTRKCEKFPTALLWYLTHGICSTPRIPPKRQDRYGLLEIEIDGIFKDCNLVCCYETTTTGVNGSRATFKVNIVMHLLSVRIIYDMICVSLLH